MRSSNSIVVIDAIVVGSESAPSLTTRRARSVTYSGSRLDPRLDRQPEHTTAPSPSTSPPGTTCSSPSPARAWSGSRRSRATAATPTSTSTARSSRSQRHDLQRTTSYQQIIWSDGGLTSGTHTVKIVANGTRPSASSNNYVQIDAFVYGAQSTGLLTSGAAGHPDRRELGLHERELPGDTGADRDPGRPRRPGPALRHLDLSARAPAVR